MDVTNVMYPGDEQRKAFTEPGPEGPIVMVNLLKFRDHATHEDGSDSHLSGRDADQRYADAAEKVIGTLGGRFIFAGDVAVLITGHVDDMWDEVLLFEYPNRAALVAMSSLPEYQAILRHREAGLDGQLLIETVRTKTERGGAHASEAY